MLVFRTEEEQRQLETKQQKVAEKDVEEERSENSYAERSETSDEEHHAFDQAHFLAEATTRTGRDFTLELSPPEVLDSSLVGRFIAFHHGDPDPGWDCGEVKCEVDLAKHTEGFTYDVFTLLAEAPSFIVCNSNCTAWATKRDRRWDRGCCCLPSLVLE